MFFDNILGSVTVNKKLDLRVNNVSVTQKLILLIKRKGEWFNQFFEILCS